MGLLVVVAFVFGGNDRNKPPVVTRATFAPITTPGNATGTLSNIPPIGRPQIDPSSPAPTLFPQTPPSVFPVLTPVPVATLNGSSTSALSVGPIFANDAGLGLFLYNVSGVATANVRVDLATGDIEALPADADRYNFVGISGAGAGAHMVTRADLGGDQASPCPDGSWWVARYGTEGQLDSLQRVRPRGGNTPTTLQAVVVDRQLQSMILLPFMATIDDLPILQGPDQQTYRLDPATGAVHKLSGGRVTNVEPGGFSEVVCTDAAVCSLLLHGTGQPVVALPSTPSTSVSFSPDGRRALVMRTDDNGGGTIVTVGGTPPTLVDVRLVDLRDGSIISLQGVPTSAATTGFRGVINASWAGWTPDSSTAIYTDGQELVRIDAATATASILPLPRDVASSGLNLVGIA